MEDNPRANLRIVPPLPTTIWVNDVMPFLPDRISLSRLQCASREIYSASKHLINTGSITPPWPNASFQVGSHVQSVAFSPDGGLLASGSEDGLVRILDRNDGRCVALKGHTASIRSVKFSPKGNIIASGSDDCSIRLTRLADHSCRVLEGHDTEVKAIAFSPDGAYLASGDCGGEIRLWGVNDDSCRSIQRDEHPLTSGMICSLTFSPDGKTLASAGSSELRYQGYETGSISFSDVSDTDKINHITTMHLAHARLATNIVYSPDGRYFASVGQDDNVQLWNATDHSSVAFLQGHKGCVLSVAFSPNGKLFVSAGTHCSIRLWSMEKKSCLLVLPNHHIHGVDSVEFSPDGQTLVSAGFAGGIRLWNPDEERNRDNKAKWEEIIRLWKS
jgi:WD40 repeat protein